MANKRTMEIEEMINLYLDGHGTKEIAELASVTPRYVRLVLSKNNIEKRPFGHWKRQYQLNEDYFKIWSNNMAYILGFFVADGLVDKDNQLISIAQKEKKILEKIKIELGSDQPLRQNNNTGVYMLNLSSKIMKNDIINLHGIMPNKSLDVKFPYVPEEYLSHFIRGYFDGDGYVNYEKHVVSFVGGSIIFMKSLIDALQEIGFEPYLKTINNHFRVLITGRYSVKRFADWIYQDKGLYLERKHQIFQREPLPLNQIKDRIEKRTYAAVASRKALFLENLLESKNIEEACFKTGIIKQTFYTWINKDTHFANQVMSIIS
jgi:intein-encoded DNA endonuclease-like protein